MTSEKINLLCEYIDENRVNEYPIYNSVLSVEPDYIRNSYFKMLAVILLQESDITESQKTLFRRLLAGVEVDYDIIEYFRQALEIEIEDYVNFTENCRDTYTRYRFIFDALLLIAIKGSSDPEQSKLLADFVESLKITKEELQYLSLLAKAVIEQNTLAYVNVEETKKCTVPSYAIKEYIDLLTNETICQNDNMTIISSMKAMVSKKGSPNTIDQIKTPIIKMVNVQLSPDNYNLLFENFDTVILENCIFENNSNDSLEIKNCKNVSLLSCKFLNNKAHAIYIKNIDSIIFKNCEFTNCGYIGQRSSWNDSIGICVYCLQKNSIKEIKFLNCSFINCFYANNFRCTSTDIVCNCKSVLCECSFNNCWNYIETDKKNDYDTDSRLFPYGTSVIDCTNINSCKIV